MLRMFGLGEGEKTELGWGQADQTYINVNVGFRFPPFPTPFLVSLIFGHQARRYLDTLLESVVLFPRWRSPIGYWQG